MPIVILAIAWLGGIWLGHLLWQEGLISCATPGWPVGLIAAAFAALTAAGLGRRIAAAARGARLPDPRYWFCPALALMAVLGVWRYQATPVAACAGTGDVAYYNGDERRPAWVTVEGIVAAYPDGRDTRTDYRVEAEHLTIAGRTQPVRGTLLVQAPLAPAARYGDRVQVTGLLAAPPVYADFDYRAYLARQGIHSLLPNARLVILEHGGGSPFFAGLYALREAGASVLNHSLPEPAAALANGMLLGLQSGIPADVNEAFKRTSTSHVIVISGSNITLLSGFLLAGLTRALGRKRARPVAAAGVALYVLLTGADPPAVRAGIAGVLYIASTALGRQNAPLASLAVAALLMTARDPRVAGDVGFQLSFMATLGLMLFAAPLRTALADWCGRTLPLAWAAQLAGIVGDLLAPTLAAQIMVLPLQLLYFGRLSPVSLFANLLILPVQPAILAGGMAALAAGLAWLPLGQALAAVPWLFLTYTTEAVKLAASLPFAAVDTGAWVRAAVPAYYAVLIIAAGYTRLAHAGRLRLPALGAVGARRATWAVGLALPLMVFVGAAAARPDGRLHIYFLTAGGGEAALLAGPDGAGAFLWDGRGGSRALAAAARNRLPTGTGGVGVALGPRAAGALWPGAMYIDPVALAPGQEVRLDGSVAITRLASGAEPVLALRYGDFRTLLPAAISQETQAALVEAGVAGPLSALKLPGRGTGAWPMQAFLAAASPRVLLWPQDTTYPPAVSEWLQRNNASRTDAAATVEVVTDGNNMWVKEWGDIGSR